MKKQDVNIKAELGRLAITPQKVGQRVDNFLITLLKGVPRSRIYQMLRKGEVRANSCRIKPNYRLKLGDMLRIPPLMHKTIDNSKQNKAISKSLIAGLNDRIIFEDQNIIALNKPSGMAVHQGTGLSFGVIEIMRACEQYSSINLVHRLDRETSGCLLLAKSDIFLRQVHFLIKNHLLTKTYLALVHGQPPFVEYKMEAPLISCKTKSGERIMKVNDNGKSAVTTFKVLQRYANASLLSVTPKTGRTHQIRVHVAHLGYPIVGDSKYAHLANGPRQRLPKFKGLFLHAQRLEFDCGRHYDIKAEMGPKLTEYLQELT